MEVASLGNDVSQVDANAQQNAAILRPNVIVDRQSVLDRHGASYCLTDAVERYQHRVAGSLHKPTAVLADRRLEQAPTQILQPHNRPQIINVKQSAVADDVGMDDSHQTTGQTVTSCDTLDDGGCPPPAACWPPGFVLHQCVGKGWRRWLARTVRNQVLAEHCRLDQARCGQTGIGSIEKGPVR
ncbi:MAG TPA: hypothetical protein VMU81_10890 [Acetobacteraceae bacterium]|nr:hypothetical protein [Acetobacteraceae bacterium]